ncbi:hypothetical protein BC351_03650 [Paenibacillus ferrarius]|uniref:Uncharacterized protein n=1 Tax=Paenibacillus ferrarius TaxID=1469647 RepID=A0A1V4HK03_9BACL|nr:hypothetical protein [Paenibacillus ferrarius]OPH57625.1 hypothetical protein BC351_03650 [Paenibacillus ferrarius]
MNRKQFNLPMMNSMPKNLPSQLPNQEENTVNDFNFQMSDFSEQRLDQFIEWVMKKRSERKQGKDPISLQHDSKNVNLSIFRGEEV